MQVSTSYYNIQLSLAVDMSASLRDMSALLQRHRHSEMHAGYKCDLRLAIIQCHKYGPYGKMKSPKKPIRRHEHEEQREHHNNIGIMTTFVHGRLKGRSLSHRAPLPERRLALCRR